MASLSWSDNSEVVAGLLIDGKISPSAIRPDSLIEPYPALVKLYQKGKHSPSTEEIITTIGPTAYQTVTSASKAVKGLPANWVVLLEQASARHETGMLLEKYAKKLSSGEDVDLAPVQAAIQRMDKGIGQLVPLSKIESEKNPFTLCGYEPLDTHMGGLPSSGLTVVGGRPGVGKTWFLIELASASSKKTKKNSIIFSLEMTAQQFAFRAKDAKKMPKEVQDRVHVCDSVLSVGDIASIASRAEGAGLIGVDFAELMLEGDGMQTEQSMSFIYRTLAWTAKNLRVPVVLLSQLNRKAGGTSAIPDLQRLRYTGMAEAMAAMVMFLYNPTQTYDSPGIGEEVLPIEPGMAYQIIAKSRFGYKWGGPGAIQVNWTDTGWGNHSHRWIPLNGGT